MNRNVSKIISILAILILLTTTISIQYAKADRNIAIAKQEIINKDIKTNLTTQIKPLSPSQKLTNAIDVTKDIQNSKTSSTADATNLFVAVRGLEYTNIGDPNGNCANQRIYSSWLTGDIWYWDCWYFEKGIIKEDPINDFFILPITVEVWKNDATLSPQPGFRAETKIYSCNGACYVLLDSLKWTNSQGIAKYGFTISRNKYLQYGKYYYVYVDVWDAAKPGGFKYSYSKEFYLDW